MHNQRSRGHGACAAAGRLPVRVCKVFKNVGMQLCAVQRKVCDSAEPILWGRLRADLLKLHEERPLEHQQANAEASGRRDVVLVFFETQFKTGETRDRSLGLVKVDECDKELTNETCVHLISQYRLRSCAQRKYDAIEINRFLVSAQRMEEKFQRKEACERSAEECARQNEKGDFFPLEYIEEERRKGQRALNEWIMYKRKYPVTIAFAKQRPLIEHNGTTQVDLKRKVSELTRELEEQRKRVKKFKSSAQEQRSKYMEALSRLEHS